MPDVTTGAAAPNPHLAPYQARGLKGRILSGVQPTKRQAQALQRIRKELASLGPCLPGSVVVRTGRCGKTTCSCRATPPRLHGPFRCGLAHPGALVRIAHRRASL